MNTCGQRTELFEEVCSTDFLNFNFGGRGYQDQLYDSIAKTGVLAGVKVELVSVSDSIQVVWVTHNFGFLGGSLGSAEGEKITRSFEYALNNNLGVCVQCRTGGARMQEGTSSLMQMAKVSVAVEALHRAGLPFISILNDPTYGGVSASYAMQADIKIATSDARIGFAGPAVILNTMCEANQSRFDTQCPADFQSASYNLDHGQVDMIIDASPKESLQSRIEATVGGIIASLMTKKSDFKSPDSDVTIPACDLEQPFNYTKSRHMERPQAQDIINTIFESFVEMSGDGRVGRDVCIRGGLATFEGKSCVVIGSFKGHTPQTMEEANYGMASPHGYRTALRLMQLAERFRLPVVTLVDTVGAWPTFECERDGQSEAIATNLTAMAGLTVPIITLMIGEGGSGGALGIGMGNTIGMLSGGYFGVISPEGAASILGRYDNDAHKAIQFPIDCQELATAQCIYANQLKSIGVVDEIIWESASGETYKNFPVLASRIRVFIFNSIENLTQLSKEEIVAHRYKKFRALGTYATLTEGKRAAAIQEANAKKGPVKKNRKEDYTPAKLLQHIGEEIVTGGLSRYRKLVPSSTLMIPPVVEGIIKNTSVELTAKNILDRDGPEALAKWVLGQKRVLMTDTTMRDAHQSLLATRARTEDIVNGAKIANELMKDFFSFECWGGATFDVCMRFLDEDPWERLREIRKACPNTCLQMLVRGSNAVGYTSYADNIVAEFVRLAALNGMDVFRIFDCFNIIESMTVTIDAVRKAGKVAEVCLCYTGDVLTSDVYNLEYYKTVAKQAVDAGAHIIGIKDMSGLLRPREVSPLLDAIRSITDLPIHFHTHSTSSGALSTCMEMARCGCNIIDFATAAMADGTSQPSMNAFVAMMEGADNDTGFNYLNLEPYDMYWARVRDMYVPFESGMKSGSARVYEHQIPGGQYSNLFVQCQSMGIYDKWGSVLDAYRDVNEFFGDIIKVTPSSKCVGDLALYLVTRSLTTKDLLDAKKAASIDYPESVVGLLRGELGFPHRGFPADVEAAILKGSPKFGIRAGLILPPADFDDNIAKLKGIWGIDITPEQGMSSLMYPKVFSDYMKRVQSKGSVLRYLPSPVYFYAMEPGQKFSMDFPSKYSKDIFYEDTVSNNDDMITVNIECKRVGPLKDTKRQVVFSVNGKEQHVYVKDSSGKFVFEGPMADVNKSSDIASPMPGVVEKMFVKEGQVVIAGETLFVISAMKMEVKVTAPCDGKISQIPVAIGTRVIEGCLLLKLA